jgi:hypothetical protein
MTLSLPPSEPTTTATTSTSAATSATTSKHLATQTEFPARTAIRAGVTSFLSTCALGAAAALAAAPIAEQAANKLFPGTPVGADIAGAAVVIGILAGAINRIANLESVAAFLTKLHLGPVPKS